MGFALPKQDPASLVPADQFPARAVASGEVSDIGEIEIRIELQYQGLIARQELESVFGEGLISPRV